MKSFANMKMKQEYLKLIKIYVSALIFLIGQYLYIKFKIINYLLKI